MDSLAAAYSSSVSRAFSSAYLLWRSSKQSAKPPQPTYRANTSCSSGVASRSSASSLFSRRMARTLLLNRSPGVPTPRASSVMWYSCRSALGTSGWRTKGETLALRWGWGGARVGSLPPWSCPSAELSAPFPGPAVFSAGPIRRRMTEICSTRSMWKPTAPSKVRSRREARPSSSIFSTRNRRPSSVISLPSRSRSEAAVSVSSRGGRGCSSFAVGGSGVGKSPITRSHFFSSRS